MFSRDRASDIDSLRSELVSTASEIRREMRAYIAEMQVAIKDGENKAGQLDERLRAMQEMVGSLAKLERDLKAETQRNIDQGAALAVAQDAIAQLQAANQQLQQALVQKQVAIEAKDTLQEIFRRLAKASIVLLIGVGVALFLLIAIGTENINLIWLQMFLFVVGAVSLAIILQQEHLLVDGAKRLMNKFFGP